MLQYTIKFFKYYQIMYNQVLQMKACKTNIRVTRFITYQHDPRMNWMQRSHLQYHTEIQISNHFAEKMHLKRRSMGGRRELKYLANENTNQSLQAFRRPIKKPLASSNSLKCSRDVKRCPGKLQMQDPSSTVSFQK